MDINQKPTIAISSCLLGELVRFNGNHCRDHWITRELFKYVDFYPICPEVEMGLGTPREEIHLYFDPEERSKIKLRGRKTGRDLTELAVNTANKINKRVNKQRVDGIILTKKSPSCGYDRVNAINSSNINDTINSMGIYAKTTVEMFPFLPKMDSGRFQNLELREQFIKAIYAHSRFKQFNSNVSNMQLFHQHYKYILMEHSPENLKLLGALLANHTKYDFEEVVQRYYQLFFSTLEIEATPKKRYNALMHVLGYFKNDLESEEKQEILRIFDEYSRGITSYMTLLRYFELLTNKYDQKYLRNQYLFAPYPKELALSRYVV